MSDFREDLLTEILDCGYGDLYLLEKCQYDIGEIVDTCLCDFGTLDINKLVFTMFDFGLRDIEGAIRDRLADLDDIAKENGGLTEDEAEERTALETLQPFEDMQSFHNCIDTSIWLSDNNKVNAYTKWMQEALNHFSKMTGFEILY